MTDSSRNDGTATLEFAADIIDNLARGFDAIAGDATDVIALAYRRCARMAGDDAARVRAKIATLSGGTE